MSSPVLTRALPALIAISLGAGCVTAGNYRGVYDELRETKRQLRSEVANRDARIATLEGDLAQTSEREAQLAESETKLREELAATTTSLDSMRQKDDATGRSLQELSNQKEALTTKLDRIGQDRARLQASTERMRESLDRLERERKESDEQVKQYRGLLAAFRKMIDAGDIDVKIERGRMVVAMRSDVLFNSGSADLSTKGRGAITDVTAILKKVSGKRFQIEGHTDNVPIHTDAYPSNWHLASARAMVVLESMLEAGMPAKRLSAASYGEHNPTRSNGSAEGRAANRRIEIVLVPDLSNVAVDDLS